MVERYPWRRRQGIPSAGGSGDKKIRVLLGCGAVGVLVAVFGPLVSEIGAILLCLTCLVCYTAFSARRGADAALPTAAEEVYLLGYLYTISALLGIGLQLGISQGTLVGSQTKLLFLVGTKLSTTVVGLLSMLYLKALAKEGTTADVPIDTARIQLIQDIIQAFMEHDVQKFHHTQQTLISTQETLNGVMRDTAQHLERTLQAVAQLNTNSQHVSVSMDKLNASLSTMASNTQELNSTQNYLNRHMTEVVSTVENMQKILDDFVSVVETKIFEQDHFGAK